MRAAARKASCASKKASSNSDACPRPTADMLDNSKCSTMYKMRSTPDAEATQRARKRRAAAVARCQPRSISIDPAEQTVDDGFHASGQFEGHWSGKVFKAGSAGLGYYDDVNSESGQTRAIDLAH